jgi:ribosomal protein S18 acetylase RimI-like enzyme
MSVINDLIVRRTLRPGDADAIVALHDRVYRTEYGRNEQFVAAVDTAVRSAVQSGWPAHSGAVWLIDDGDRLVGSLGLTVECPGTGRVRWFVFAPELRGRGLGAALIDELVAEARAAGLQRLELETFSALTAAARIYRRVGFEVVWERPLDTWGPPITYQRYELRL